MEQYKSILYEKEDYIARITINRPEARNSITIEMCQEISKALQDARDDPAIGVIVLTGSGDKIFCPGLDLVYSRTLFNNTDEVLRLTNTYSQVVLNIRLAGKPVIARINGLTAGGGCEWLIACDLAIAAEHARFQQGEGGVGAISTFATQSLTPIMGDRKARWFLFTDEVIDAKTALEYSLVNKVVPYDKLDEELDKLCQNLLNKGPWSLRFTKDQLNVWFWSVIHTIPQGNDFWSLQSATPEPLEGMSAFVEKRSPDHMAFRRKAAAGKSHTYLWGPPTRTCPKCRTKHMPEEFEFCGKCGAKLT